MLRLGWLCLVRVVEEVIKKLRGLMSNAEMLLNDRIETTDFSPTDEDCQLEVARAFLRLGRADTTENEETKMNIEKLGQLSRWCKLA